MLKKKNLLFGENSKINQILCAILINLPVISYGASIGWMSPMSLLLQSKDSPKGVPLTDTEISWMAAVPYLICIPANTVIAYFVDKYGRKLALILVSLAGAASWTLLLVSLDIWALILARALVGITMSGCYIICPIYTKEISEDSIRGALGCFKEKEEETDSKMHLESEEEVTIYCEENEDTEICAYEDYEMELDYNLINIGDFVLANVSSSIILFHTIGNLLLYVMGDLLNYYQILWVCLTVPIIHLSLFVFMPDSPSYLVKTGKVERATKAVAWLRCRSETDNVVQEEINLISEEHKKDSEANQFFLKTIFTDKILFKAFQIAMISTLAREVCGAIPVLNFAGEIFTLASSDNKGLILSPNQQAMLLGAVQVVGSIIASGLVEKCGRKPLLFISSLISGLSMCVLASWFLMRDYDVITPSWIPLFTLCLCIFCDSSGLQPMSVVLSGEIFSFKYRGTVMATAMCGSSLSDFLQLLFFKPLANSIGIHVAFYFFGLVCLFMAAYVIIVIPETRARTLEDIYQDLGKKKIPEDNCDKEVTRV